MSQKTLPPRPTSPPARDKNKKRLARTVLLKQLKRLQKVCGTLETPDQWYDAVSGVQGALNEFGDVLPVGSWNGLNDALSLSDPTRTGLQKACEVLSNRLTDTISELPGGGLLAPLALAATLIVAVIVFVGVVVLNANSVELDIVNRNCATIVIAGEFPGLDWFGMSLPDKPIVASSTGVARLAPLALTIDATDPATVNLTLGVFTLPVGNSSALAQATFNGTPLLGKRTTINLGAKPKHEMIVQCK